ncbi:hypothetical protein DL762_008761 [Monosporascus cannonballus]|uniref:holo-[acyl-carrier-protein] synthase n=1 Tax=Monosporascus cannonballus TaxID=155416 RepID=A0ABY0GZV3_9PEZI|nr:hypothetical protein DL762_008761 [Monosporascus cannonballus]
MGSENLKVVQYLVDTRKLWPGAAKTSQLEDVASDALELLPREERDKVLKYYFVADAKMSLVSHLLKHWVVARYAGVPWAETKLTRDERTKPVYVDAGRQPVVFNVSHQAGLVALVAAYYDRDQIPNPNADGGPNVVVDVGVDVVCTSERRDRDHRTVRADGWTAFVDMHAEVFGTREVAFLKSGDLPLAREEGEEQVVDSKLRFFYTLWCLREAYVKMTGAALLAPWLKDLNFLRFRPPAPGREGGDGAAPGEDEMITTHEILFKGQEVDDVNVCIRSIGPDYMVCTAIRTPERKEDALGIHLGPFEYLSLEEILDVAKV